MISNGRKTLSHAPGQVIGTAKEFVNVSHPQAALCVPNGLTLDFSPEKFKPPALSASASGLSNSKRNRWHFGAAHVSLYDEVSRKRLEMSFLVSIGILLAAPVGLTVALALRGRRSRRINQNQIDAGKADSLSTWVPGPGDRFLGEYLPPQTMGALRISRLLARTGDTRFAARRGAQ